MIGQWRSVASECSGFQPGLLPGATRTGVLAGLATSSTDELKLLLARSFFELGDIVGFKAAAGDFLDELFELAFVGIAFGFDSE